MQDAGIERVRLVKDKLTGESRGFAFVKFISIEHSRMFMEAHFPVLDLDGCRIKIDYSKTGPREDLEDWICSKVIDLN